MWLLIVGLVLLFFVLLAVVPLGVGLSYGEKLRVSVYLAHMRILRFPRKKKMRIKRHKHSDKEADTTAGKQRKKKKQDGEQKAKKQKKPAEKKRTFSETSRFVTDLAVLVRDLLLKFAGYAKVRVAVLRVVIATGDAAQTAKLYGAAEAVVAQTLALLDECVNLRADTVRDISVNADFLAEKSSIVCDIRLQLRVWQLLCLGVSALFGYLGSKRKHKPSKS